MKPATLISILNFNNYEQTVQCVENLSIVRYPQDILVIDNGSKNDSYEQLSQKLSGIGNLSLIRGENNRCAKGFNTGAKYACKNGYDKILFLNSDVTVSPTFLGELEKGINEDGLTVCGPMVLERDAPNIIQSIGGKIRLDLARIYHDYKGLKDTGEFLEVIPTEYVSGCCALFDTEVFNKQGFFDEDYFFYFFLPQFFMALPKNSIGVMPNSRVYHQGKASMDVSTKLDLKLHYSPELPPEILYHTIHDRFLFMEKNKSALSSQSFSKFNEDLSKLISELTKRKDIQRLQVCGEAIRK